MQKLFGTDGVRGVANTELSANLALRLGAASAYVLRGKHEGARILVGRDPRISGDVLESALAAGVCSLGVDIYLVGVVPTPGVAYLAKHFGADAGIVISASHNPMRDNGIKFFGPDGHKLSDDIEAEIEAQVGRFDELPFPEGPGVGRMYRARHLVDRYVNHLKQTFPHRLDGISIALDCANGAASDIAPQLFADLGAAVAVINAQPDGININRDSGALHTNRIRRLVAGTDASIGFSFDGDADRAILSDEHGNLVDGDHVMAVCGLHLARKGHLPGNVVVGTVMSNIGLELALKQEGIELARAAVGDRYVSEEMRRRGAMLGGEKSGHIIFGEHTTTGDGMITALQVLNVMIETGKPLSELADVMEEYPQLLENVPVRDRTGWETNPDIREAIRRGEERLAGHGRVLVRASGTEKLIRVMAEGPDMDELRSVAHDICEVVRGALG